MHEKIITIYCLCAEFLLAWGVRDDPQCQMTTAEVMTTALVAAAFFHGHQERSRHFLREFGFIPTMLSASRFNRRLHAISEATWQALFALLSEAAKQTNRDQEYIADSFPVPVCDNYRICRCRLYRSEVYRGRISSKPRYFYGLGVHLVITKTGQPVEFVLAPGACADIRIFQQMARELPEGAHLYADPAYTDYTHEDLLQEVGIHLMAGRKRNSQRPHPGWVQFVCEQTRKR